MSLFYVLGSYLALGALAGTVAGLFGIGGGLIIVPVLMFSFGLQGVNPDIIPHLAVGTSLATIVFTSISSIRSHNRHGAVRLDLFRPMAVGIVFGAVLGAWTASLLSGRALELVIGIFVVLVGLKMLFQVDPKPGRCAREGWPGARWRRDRLGVGDFWYWWRNPHGSLPELV